MHLKAEASRLLKRFRYRAYYNTLPAEVKRNPQKVLFCLQAGITINFLYIVRVKKHVDTHI